MLSIIATILIIISLVIYVAFIAHEGTDERAQAILSKSSRIAFIFIILGFIFQSVYYQFANPTVEQIRTLIYIWMALIFCSNSLSIKFLQRTM